jgi:DNA polymerase-3 subunit alpha
VDFTPLQVNSSFSLLKSPIRIQELVTTAKSRGYSALALTDKNVLYGAVDFYNVAKKAGIKPLIGLQLTITLDNVDGTNLELVFLAKDRAGYRNLMELSTLQQTSEVKKLPLTLNQIKSMLSSLYIIIPPQATVFSWLENNGAIIELLNETVDEDSLLLGINPQLDQIQRSTLQQLATNNSLSLVGISPVEYLNADDLFASKVLQAIGANVQLENIETNSKKLGSHYLHPQSDVIASYQQANLEQAAAKTVEIAQNCNIDFEFKQPVLPHFATPEGQSSSDYLRHLCIEGLKNRQVAPGLKLGDYQQRLAKELKVIHEMGFDDYFLIVWDVMRFAHRTKITTDPGRGSAAGSLVAYALAITDVDPLQYHLLFERFLNPERAQMPDIDLDIPDNRRGEVLQYVHQKYGHERVAQIITFGTLAAKQVIRDVSRVFGLNRYAMNELVGTLPHGLHITLAGSLKESQRLRNLLNDHPEYKVLYQVAQKLEGLPRHYSIHAAGVVLSEKPLHEIVPLQNGSEGLLMTQFPKDTVEALGLLKMDFLGLRNLSIMDNTLKLIRHHDPQFSLSNISLADLPTLSLFQKGLTDGVFQFESAGIREVLVNLHPDIFEDIVAVNALYRPGPLENIPHFIARKRGQEKYQLPDPSLKPILGATYGILVYQEQVMQLASAMAGFSLGEADLLRRAMSKKKRATMESMRTRFMKGAKANGYSESIAEQVFDYIDQFANYGFNRSHAVAYSKMAFQMAYLKAHYPAEFFTALMNAEPNVAKLKAHVQDARHFGVQLVGPRINQSQAQFSIHDKQLYFGLASIKGLRRDLIREILQERQQNGPYKEIRNFISRLGSKWQKAELIAPLIYAGAFDGLGYNRAEMINALPMLISGIQLFSSSDELGTDPELQSTIASHQEYPLTERLAKENEYLGVYLSGHPVTQYRDLATRYHVQTASQLRPRENVVVLVLINRVKTIHTKKDHRQMAFVSGTDQTGEIEVTIFPRQYDRYQQLLQDNQVVMVNGHTEQRAGHGLQVIADRIQDVNKLRQQQRNSQQRWFLRIMPENDNQQVLQQLYKFMAGHHGTIPVIIYYPETDQKKIQPRSRWLDSRKETRQGLIKLLGQPNVVLQQSPQ